MSSEGANLFLSFVGWVDGSWVEGQAGMGQEPDHEVLVLADTLDALGGGVGDLGQGSRGQIRQLDVLEVGSEDADRAQFGGIGREPLGTEPVALAVELGPHPVAPVSRESAPDEHHPLPGVEPGELVQDLDEGVGVVAGLLQVEAQPSG